jgi:hypothetical protein
MFRFVAGLALDSVGGTLGTVSLSVVRAGTLG